jgi:hypothetical protein
MAKTEDEGRCDTCGFLAMRFYHDAGLHEATQEFRELGLDTNAEAAITRLPFCIVQAARLDKEIEAHHKSTQAPNMSLGAPSIMAILQKKDRECREWTEWIPGFSPKEHLEMMNRERMQKWQEEREEADRKWRTEQEEKTRQWQERMAKGRLHVDIVVFAIGVTVILSASTIIAAFIERGSIP